MNGSRPGAVLVLALILLILMDCVLLGTLQLAAQQRRIAEHRLERVRLQFAAEDAVARTLAAWPDSVHARLHPGSTFTRSFRHGATTVDVRTEALLNGLALISARAVSATGARQDAALLAVMPPLPDSVLYSATIIGGSGVTILDGAVIRATEQLDCSSVPHAAIRTGGPLHLGSATIEGSISSAPFPRPPDPGAHPGSFSRAPGDTIIVESARGVLVAGGTITLAGAAHFEGLMLAGGDLVVESSASLSGTAAAAGRAEIAGRATGNPCMVRAAVRAAGLDVARPADRSWIPAF